MYSVICKWERLMWEKYLYEYSCMNYLYRGIKFDGRIVDIILDDAAHSFKLVNAECNQNLKWELAYS